MNHFDETFFDKVFLQWTSKVALLRGTYRCLRDNWLVHFCGENPATFSTVEQHNGAAVSMELFKELMVHVWECKYEMLYGFGDARNEDFSNNVEITSH